MKEGDHIAVDWELATGDVAVSRDDAFVSVFVLVYDFSIFLWAVFIFIIGGSVEGGVGFLISLYDFLCVSFLIVSSNRTVLSNASSTRALVSTCARNLTRYPTELWFVCAFSFLCGFFNIFSESGHSRVACRSHANRSVCAC